jgi:hypothetical protein
MFHGMIRHSAESFSCRPQDSRTHSSTRFGDSAFAWPTCLGQDVIAHKCCQAHQRLLDVVDSFVDGLACDQERPDFPFNLDDHRPYILRVVWPRRHISIRELTELLGISANIKPMWDESYCSRHEFTRRRGERTASSVKDCDVAGRVATDRNSLVRISHIQVASQRIMGTNRHIYGLAEAESPPPWRPANVG